MVVRSANQQDATPAGVQISRLFTDHHSHQLLSSGFERQHRVIRIASGASTEKCLALRNIEWSAATQSLHEIGVGDVESPERDEIGEIATAHLKSRFPVVAVVGVWVGVSPA